MNIDVAKKLVIDEKITYHNNVDSKTSLINSLKDRLKCCTTEHVSLDYINNIVVEPGNILVQSAKEIVGTQKMYVIKIPKLLRNHGLQENVNLQDKIFEKQKDYIKNMIRENIYK